MVNKLAGVKLVFRGVPSSITLNLRRYEQLILKNIENGLKELNKTIKELIEQNKELIEVIKNEHKE